MKRFLFGLCSITLVVGCLSPNKETTAILDKAEQCIEHHPDSSLQMLNTLQLSSLSTHKGRARYALLKSMAMDKNYIDATSDSLTSIALAYYKKHGTPDDKLKAYYYNGRICRNNKDYEGAMANYLNAEKYVKDCKDYVSVGRLYNAKTVIYKEIFNLDMAIKPTEMSGLYYLKGGDTVRYITSLNNMTAIFLTLNKYDSVGVCFSRIEDLEKYMTIRQKNSYYINLINYKIAKSDSTLTHIVEEYINCFTDKSKISWRVVADAYLKMGKAEMAYLALKNADGFNNAQNSEGVYHYTAYEVYRTLGDYRSALDHLEKYQSMSSSKDLNILRSDTKFLEERYYAQKKELEHKYYIVILLMGVIMFMMLLVISVRYYRDLNNRRMLKLQEMEEQKNVLSNQYEKALSEQRKLRSLLVKQSFNENLRRTVEERLEILNNFIVSNISGIDMDKSLQELARYMENNEEFLQSTRKSFELTHPKFISYLTKKKLTEWEIGCCCLYCTGLNGNEIANYLDVKYFYKHSSIIRKKLGIQSVNIDTFLIDKAKELS